MSIRHFSLFENRTVYKLENNPTSIIDRKWNCDKSVQFPMSILYRVVWCFFFRLGTNFEIFKCPLSIRRRHRTPLLISFSLTLLCMSKIEPVLCESFVVTWSLINRTSRPNSLMCLCVKHPDEPDLLTPTLWCACWLDKCDSTSVFSEPRFRFPDLRLHDLIVQSHQRELLAVTGFRVFNLIDTKSKRPFHLSLIDLQLVCVGSNCPGSIKGFDNRIKKND